MSGEQVKFILSQLTNHLEKHYEGLRSAFLNVDHDQNGYLSASEFAAVFKVFNFPISPQDLNLLMSAFDSNKDGKISYLEFCHTLVNGPWAPMKIQEPKRVDKSVPAVPMVSSDEAKLKVLLIELTRAVESRWSSVQEAFMKIDTDRSGYISAQELIGVLHNHGLRVGWDDIQLLVDYFDVNGDGLISWSEFCAGIQMNKFNPRGAGDNKACPAPKPHTPHGQAKTETGNPLNTLHLELRRFMDTRYETHRDAFLAINTSRSGAINKSELGMILAKGAVAVPSEAAVDALLKAYDLNGDGLIQFSEYVKAMNKNQI